MRSEYHVSQGGEAVARGPRLHGVRIEARAGDRACFQRLVQRVLVDQPAAAGIDEKGTGSHGGEERSIGESRVLWDVDRKSTRLNSSHGYISYAVFCLKKKKNK